METPIDMRPIIDRAERLNAAEQIESAIPVTANVMRSIYEQQFGLIGLNLKQALILGHLDVAEHHTMNQTEIARLAGMQKPAAGIAIDNLVARKLVERVADPNDGRAKLLSLTHAGRQLARDVDRIFGEIASVTRRNTTAAQRRAVVATLTAVRENLASLLETTELVVFDRRTS